MLGDTIAAVSTPRGKGGVALLRVSGPSALEICEKVFSCKNGKRLSDIPARYAVYGSFVSRENDGIEETIDDGLATVFNAPASFTGEETVELCCHGGILVTETVLTSLLVAGARLAEAGEFTRRAFLNGKMGLSSAEALGNLLEAQTREQLRLAHAGTDGRLEKRCREIYTFLRDVLAAIYVKIDYPDEELADMSRGEMDAALTHCIASLQELSATYQTGHAIAEGIPTVICGRPNVGKSSLYNCIVGREAAIVTDVEGTTRDVLCETAVLGRTTLRLFDTAGLRETSDPVEKIGVSRAKEAVEAAELLLAVFDGSCAPTDEDECLIAQLRASSATVIAVINKTDVSSAFVPFYQAQFESSVCICAAKNIGLNDLTETVEKLFLDGRIDVKNDAILTNARQNRAVLAGLEGVRRAQEALRQGLPVELCCAETEAAMEALSELDGRAVSEEIVHQIFSHFCVGK